MLSDGPAGPGQRRRRAGGAWLVEAVHGAYPPGVGAAPRRHPDVAPRSATTLASEWCTCEENAEHAAPSSVSRAGSFQRVTPRGTPYDPLDASAQLVSTPVRPPRGRFGHRASRPNPAGRPWAHGGASTVRIELRARSARKVNVCIPRAFATSQKKSKENITASIAAGFLLQER